MSALDLLPSVGSESALLLLAAAGSFVTVLALGRAAMPGNAVAARARAHAQRRRQLRAALLSPGRRGRAASMSFAKHLVERLKLNRGPESKTAADRLAQAGIRSRDAVAVFLALRCILPVIFAASSWIAVTTLGLDDASTTTPLLVATVGAILGCFGPNLVVGRLLQRRKKAVQKGLPDALDLMVICAEAGLSLDAMTARVAREIAPSAPELADELGLTAIELGFLPNRRAALQNLTRRVELPAVRGLVNTLVQTERYGTPLAHSLRVLAAEFREQRMLRAEEKAARLPATLTVPMILFILPALFIVLIGPAIIQVVATFGK